MAVPSIFFNIILLAFLFFLPFLAVSLHYGASTKSRFNQLSVLAISMLCVPVVLYMWINKDADASNTTAAFSSLSEAQSEINSSTAEIEDLKFSDFFKLPVGPQGLETTQRLTALEGKKVRITGYMVQQEIAIPGIFLLTPLPAKTREADDSMADDLPPSTVFVHIHSYSGHVIKHRPGLLQLTGVLSVGPKEESDTRVSNVRLMLDNATSHAMVASN